MLAKQSVCATSLNKDAVICLILLGSKMSEKEVYFSPIIEQTCMEFEEDCKFHRETNQTFANIGEYNGTFYQTCSLESMYQTKIHLLQPNARI
jgi:hypothetical protein